VLDLNAPEKSVLIESLAADADPHMPPKKQLSVQQIEVLKRWAKDGAAWDAASLINEPSPARAVSLAALPASYRPVLALALSPDSTRLAVGCGNEVVLYDVAGTNLSVVARASGHLDPVQSMAWSQDGTRLVTGAFRRVLVWNAAALTMEREITDGLTDRIAALRFLPDGKQFVVADGRVAETGTLRIIDAASGAITASWTAHADTIFDLAVSSDGKLLATAGGDKLVKLWDLATHAEIAKLEGHVSQVLTLAFDAKATQLVTGGMDQQLKVWDVKTRERINTLGTQTAAVTAVAWSSAGPAVIAVTEAGAVLRYTELQSHTGGQQSESAKERKLEAADASLHCVAVTPNGERIFAGSQDGRLFSWNKDGKLEGKTAISEAPPSPSPSPSFIRDVLPVLSKAGCNAGACHAKPDGQNGFHLTVFSYDPKSDYRQILQDARGRRVFPSAPEESLILLKATESIPHEGGERFAKDSDAYRTLVQWISGGMIYRGENEPSLQRISVQPAERSYRKGDTQQLTVQAHYSDGSVREVTALAGFASNDKEIARVTDDGLLTAGKVSGQAVVVARFMGLVGDSRISVPADRTLPATQYASLPVNNFIDELAYAQFQRLGLFPSEPCTDAEFLRRASLDTIGALPSPEEARAFLADPGKDKRDKLIDRLLAHPFYADFWANKWADLLRPNSDRVGIKSVYVLDQWLRESFRANQPYDQFVRDIVLTEGNTHRFGPAVIYRDRREPADLTTMFSQLFLGVRLDCAKCHHHPNEKWGQDDFYKMAAFFGPLKRKGAGISAPISAGNETLYFAPGKTVKHPVTGELMEPQAPDGPPVKVADNADPRRALADWLTDAKNPFFAKAVANRIWAAFFGKGLVDPVDDFRISNPPANPALLDALAQEVVRQKFDLKALMRTILRSHLYQLSATPNEFNRADTRNFSRAYRRRLPAETLADALADVTGIPDIFAGMPPGSRAMQAWTYKIDSQTMDAFGRPNSSTDCPCERDTRPSIVQSLHLMNSRLLQEKLASKDAAARVQRLAESQLPPEEIVTELYLACYTRPPTDEEMKIAAGTFTAEGATRRTASEDVLWSLLNSAEFVFDH
jgi:WD40 repeat protein